MFSLVVEYLRKGVIMQRIPGTWCITPCQFATIGNIFAQEKMQRRGMGYREERWCTTGATSHRAATPFQRASTSNVVVDGTQLTLWKVRPLSAVGPPWL